MSTAVRAGLGVGIAVFVLVLPGALVRATYGAQTTADEPQYLLTAISIAEDWSLDISDERYEGRYREFHEANLPVQTLVLEGGIRISPHNPLLPLLLAGPVTVGGWLGAKAVTALVGGLVAGLVVWVGVARFGIRPLVAILVSLVFGLSPPLAIYATQIYPEIWAALAVLLAVIGLTGPRGGWLLVLVGVVALPWLAVKYLPLAAVLAALGLMSTSRRWWLSGLLVLAGAVYVLFHLDAYGGLTPYATGDHFVDGELTALGYEPNLIGRSTRLAGLMVDREFGLAAWQPAYLFLPLALWGRRKELWLPIGTAWLVATFVAFTMHGWWFPGRQVVVVLPLVALVIARWAGKTRMRTLAVGSVAALGVGSYLFLAIEGLRKSLTWVVDFSSTGYPFYRLWRMALPDYQLGDASTWVLHGFWTVILAALLWLGYRERKLT